MGRLASLRMQGDALTSDAANWLAGPRDGDVGRETIGSTSWRALLLGAPPRTS